MILLTTTVMMMLAVFAWDFLSGREGSGECKTIEKFEEATWTIWEQWARLLSHNVQPSDRHE